MTNAFKEFRIRLGRLGAVRLPIGKPWFALLNFGAGYRLLWPASWQGWAAAAALPVWMSGSVAVFLSLGWEPDDTMFYCWLLPTTAVSALIVGLKTDLRAGNGL